MVAKINIILGLGALLIGFPAHAEDIDMNMAQMQDMDKITGRVSMIEVPVGGEVKFGTFSVVVRACKARSEEEVPENTAFVDVTDKSFDKEEFNIFKGWMFSSSPAVNAVEHPIYDVWLIKCFNGEPKPEELLSEEQLAARDALPTLREIKTSQKELEQDDSETIETIQFKDAMYKVENPENPQPDEKEKGEGPENLLNIKDNYKTPQEESVVIPADELSAALNAEAENLAQKNPQPEISQDELTAIEETTTIDAPQDDSPINDDLAAAIEAELARHQVQ